MTIAFVTSIVNALNQTTSLFYLYGIGKVDLAEDPNGVATNYYYNDPLDRLTQVTFGNGGNTYDSCSTNPVKVMTQQDQNSAGDRALKSQTASDGLGRPIESDTFESPSQYIATTTAYDALGRVATTTNPSRPGDGLNFTTTYTYDALGRVTQATTANGVSADNGSRRDL